MSSKKDPIKVCLLGDSYTGKTSLAFSFLNQPYPSYIPTTAGDQYDFTSDNHKYYSLFDTGCSQMSKMLNSLYYGDSQIIMFVYDVTRRGSFNNLKEYSSLCCCK